MFSKRRPVLFCGLFMAVLIGSGITAQAKADLDAEKPKVSAQESFTPSLRVKVNADEVKLRCKPNTDAQIVTTLKKGALVEVEARIENWCKVSYGRYFGYVSVEYLDLPQEVKEKDYSTLSMGMSSSEVMRLQEALMELGYYNGRCNGTYGAKTREAVRAFQQDKGLEADGIATADVQKLLHDRR